MERALVLLNLLLYLSVCEKRSGIVEFCVIFFHILKNLVEIIQLLFVHVCCIFVLLFLLLYLSSYVKIASLSEKVSSAIYLVDFWSDSE